MSHVTCVGEPCHVFVPVGRETDWMPCRTGLRVEFLLKTDSGYPRDAEVTLFTLANPEHSLRFNTHWSAPPVSALARKIYFCKPPINSRARLRKTVKISHPVGLLSHPVGLLSCHTVGALCKKYTNYSKTLCSSTPTKK